MTLSSFGRSMKYVKEVFLSLEQAGKEMSHVETGKTLAATLDKPLHVIVKRNYKNSDI